jgi:hypothetical protein
MKILYIDNKRYLHNEDIHIDFIASLERNKLFKIIGYGNFLSKKLSTSIKIKKDIDKQLDYIVKRYKPDAILTYNSGGKNIKLYSWVSDKLSKIDIPKFHITTDYMRNGFEEEQADWFEYVGYDAAIFRTKDSLRHPLGVKKFLLPFSVSSSLYNRNVVKNIARKKDIVGFVGSYSIEPYIYFNRIAAMGKLRDNDLLNETEWLEKQNRSQMIFGPQYVKFLTNNLFNLTCGGNCNYFTAKHFQIPAAYAMLVCTDVVGLEDFPKDCYIKYDINNLEKLIEDVRFHISNKGITAEKINILHEHVMRNHNHKIRGKQLKEFIERCL